MGCSASMPAPEKFLADPQPAPPGGYLLDGVPLTLNAPESVVAQFQEWNGPCCPGYPYHVEGDTISATNIFSELNDVVDGGASTREYVEKYDDSEIYLVGAAGIGTRQTRPIMGAGGNMIMTLSLPPHCSFGRPAQLKDAAGKVVAAILTAQTTRPFTKQATAVNVWGTKPQFSGQAPTAFPDGSQAYLWATIKRDGKQSTGLKSMTRSTQIVDGRNNLIATCSRVRGVTERYKVVTPDGAGLALCNPLKTDKMKYEYTCAQGVDTALIICYIEATQMSEWELFTSKQDAKNAAFTAV